LNAFSIRGCQLVRSATITSLGLQVLYRPQIDSEQLRANVFAFGGEDLRHKKVSIGRLWVQVRKIIQLDGKVEQAHRPAADRFHGFSHLTAFTRSMQPRKGRGHELGRALDIPAGQT
jgi:hypothetical protein